MIQNYPLVVFSTISDNNAFVYRRDCNWRNALQNHVMGCNLVSKYYFLTGAVKQMVLFYLSALCHTIDIDQGFLDNQMHSSNFRKRMETSKRDPVQLPLGGRSTAFETT
jgi:hypothetical protein